MTHPESIASLKERIAKAAKDAAVWRAAGGGEKYLEAYSRMEALELELAALEDAAGRAARLEASASHKAASPSAIAAMNEAQRMAELSIAYDGVRYHYRTYRYDRLEDAVAYATFERSRKANRPEPLMPMPAMVAGPDDEQRRAMASSGITYRDGAYHLGEFRYDRLDDALSHARLRAARG